MQGLFWAQARGLELVLPQVLVPELALLQVQALELALLQVLVLELALLQVLVLELALLQVQVLELALLQVQVLEHALLQVQVLEHALLQVREPAFVWLAVQHEVQVPAFFEAEPWAQLGEEPGPGFAKRLHFWWKAFFSKQRLLQLPSWAV